MKTKRVCHYCDRPAKTRRINSHPLAETRLVPLCRAHAAEWDEAIRDARAEALGS